MFMDALTMLSDAQAITADAVSTNTIDLGNPTVKNRVGTGQPLGVAMQVDSAADITTGDETYAFEVIQSANANLSSPTVIGRFVLTAAQLGLGKKFSFPIMPGAPSARYLGMNYDVGGTTPLLTVTASVMPLNMIESEYTYYPKGYAA